MGLPTAVKAADPDGRLRWRSKVRQVGGEDSLQPPAILSLAHEVLQLVAQHVPFFPAIGRRHLRDTVVRDGSIQRIPDEYLVVHQHEKIPSSPVIGMAW